MAESNKHLNLVFSEDGEEPLVLGCSWTGDVNREPPNLKDVRAKPRLRALCILLVLAKYREDEAPQGSLIFKAEIRKGTWICTLTNDLKKVIAWVKRNFHIFDDELFVSGSVGATHNKGGKKHPHMEFHPEKLPLCNLHISRKSHLHNAQPRPLLREEMISFALKLESKHWKISAIEKIFPETIEGSGGATSIGKSVNANAKDVPPDEKLIFQALLLLEREFDTFRDKCKPYYSFMEKQYSNVPSWSKDRIEFFLDNLYFHFCSGSSAADDLNIAKRDLFNGEMIGPELDDEIGVLIFKANEHLCQMQPYIPYRGWMEFGKTLLLKEARGFRQTLSDSSECSSRYLVFGMVIALQLIYFDFMSEAFCSLITAREGLDCSLEDFMSFIINVKGKYLVNMDILRRHRIHQTNLLEALQGARPVLKAHVDFLKALQGWLIELEK